jgi:hypothetical protein
MRLAHLFGGAITMGLILSPIANAGAQTRTAPSTVMRNPNAPRPPIGNPEPRPGRPPPVMYTVLAFTVWTGDDDLRENSIVWADIKLPDGSTAHCDLRPGSDSWDNNSVHPAPPCALPAPERLGELKAAKITLGYDGDPVAAESGGKNHAGNVFDTYDNWNVNQVRVFAENPAEHQKACLFDASGKPLVRMKESVQTFPLSDAWSSC